MNMDIVYVACFHLAQFIFFGVAVICLVKTKRL